jgi:hypothetical protein
MRNLRLILIGVEDMDNSVARNLLDALEKTRGVRIDATFDWESIGIINFLKIQQANGVILSEKQNNNSDKVSEFYKRLTLIPKLVIGDYEEKTGKRVMYLPDKKVDYEKIINFFRKRV